MIKIDISCIRRKMNGSSLCFSLWLLVFLSPLQIKTGAPCRSERLAKYNQLMRWVFIAFTVYVAAFFFFFPSFFHLLLSSFTFEFFCFYSPFCSQDWGRVGWPGPLCWAQLSQPQCPLSAHVNAGSHTFIYTMFWFKTFLTDIQQRDNYSSFSAQLVTHWDTFQISDMRKQCSITTVYWPDASASDWVNWLQPVVVQCFTSKHRRALPLMHFFPLLWSPPYDLLQKYFEFVCPVVSFSSSSSCLSWCKHEAAWSKIVSVTLSVYG